MDTSALSLTINGAESAESFMIIRGLDILSLKAQNHFYFFSQKISSSSKKVGEKLKDIQESIYNITNFALTTLKSNNHSKKKIPSMNLNFMRDHFLIFWGVSKNNKNCGVVGQKPAF